MMFLYWLIFSIVVSVVAVVIKDWEDKHTAVQKKKDFEMWKNYAKKLDEEILNNY
jgi:hypothetical protein